MQLYIVRHGFAGTSLEDEEMDKARPLKKKGKEQMKGVAKGLKEMEVSFDRILTSPLLRAKMSAEILNDHCGNAKSVEVTDLLLPEGSHQKLIKHLNQLKRGKVAIVGHEPFLSSFASLCLTNSLQPFLNLKKGGVLMLETDGQIKPEKCKLHWLMEPLHLSK